MFYIRPKYKTLAGILIFMIVDCIFVLFFIYDEAKPILHERTAETQATVVTVEKETHTVYERSSQRTETYYNILVYYYVNDILYKAHKTDSREYVEGQEVIITYDVDDPNQIYLPGFLDLTVRVSYILISGLLILIFCYLMIERKY